jgi:hypothetical protein
MVLISVCTSCFALQVLSQWPGLPDGVKFEPTDLELLGHLEGKVGRAASHVLIDDFIPTIEAAEGICYTHPENLPGTWLLFHLILEPSKWICRVKSWFVNFDMSM